MNRDIKVSLLWAGGIIGLALVASYARRLGHIDGDITTRIVLAAIGLMIAWFGNRVPKAFVPNASARQANRVTGWSMAISGLIYAGLWAFAPFNIALIGGCGAIIVGMAVTLGYCLSLRDRARSA
jgi:hypothetical protein